MVRTFLSITVPLGAEWLHVISRSLIRYFVGLRTVKFAIMTLLNPAFSALTSSFTAASAADLGDGPPLETAITITRTKRPTTIPTPIRSFFIGKNLPLPGEYESALFWRAKLKPSILPRTRISGQQRCLQTTIRKGC